MAESDLNKRICAALRGRDPRRCENAVDAGTPDIHYIGGWVESKQLPAFPKRADTVVAVPHYVPAQRGWHVRRCMAGGRCHVVIEVGTTTFVFDGMRAAEHLGIDWTRQDMATSCLWMCSPWNRKAFREFIDRCDADRA